MLGPPNFSLPEFFHSFRGAGGFLAGPRNRGKQWLLFAALPIWEWVLKSDQSGVFRFRPRILIIRIGGEAVSRPEREKDG
jgi:hypothetical protein